MFIASEPQNQRMIETKRLILRPWSVADATALYKYASDPRVSELALWPAHTSVEMSREVIEKFFMTNPHSFAIVLKDSGEPVGCIGLVPAGDEHHEMLQSEREVGYWIGRPYWNAGLTTEALKALIDYCREKLNLSSLMITTDDRNIASARKNVVFNYSTLIFLTESKAMLTAWTYTADKSAPIKL